VTRPSHVLAIDPGLAGALALLDLNLRKIHTIWDMPLKEGKIHPEGVAFTIDLAKSIASANLVAVIENVNARPRQAGMWTFAVGVGVVHGCLAAHGVPLSLIQPAAWKSACGLRRLTTETQADTKTKARELAARLFPESADLFRRVRDDGRAESVLIGRFLAVKNGWL
jgi:crossover junction endodeoxyribonuclease RuvC